MTEGGLLYVFLSRDDSVFGIIAVLKKEAITNPSYCMEDQLLIILFLCS